MLLALDEPGANIVYIRRHRNHHLSRLPADALHFLDASNVSNVSIKGLFRELVCEHDLIDCSFNRKAGPKKNWREAVLSVGCQADHVKLKLEIH